MIPRMRLLIVGPTSPASYESSCARYFAAAGCEVHRWDSKGIYGRHWWKRPVRTVLDLAASAAFVRHVCALRPEVVFMPKAENLHHRAVREALDRTGARLVVWYPDNPFLADNTSFHILRNFAQCDLFYIWGKFLVEPLRSVGCRRVEYLPFGFDPELHPEVPSTGGEPIPCLHIGAYSEEKRDALVPLAGSGLSIWGPNWHEEVERGGPLAGCVRGGGLYGREMAETYGRALVVANPIRLQNMPAHNLRTIEAAGIGGGVVLTQRTVEQGRELFTEDEHLFCYGSAAEMQERVEWAVAHPGEVRTMSARARQHVLRHHLLEFRIRRILGDLNL